MAGVKGRSGGRRVGAGRKPKQAAPDEQAQMFELPKQEQPQDAEHSQPGSKEIDCAQTDDPLEFLLAVMNDKKQSPSLRLRAALAACQYKHPKKGEGGKKEDRQGAAERAAGQSKFAPTAPPKLSIVK